MRLRDVPLVLERRHLVANSGGRYRQPVLFDERVGADGLGRRDVLVDDEAEESLAPFGEFVWHFRKAISTLMSRVLTYGNATTRGALSQRAERAASTRSRACRWAPRAHASSSRNRFSVRRGVNSGSMRALTALAGCTPSSLVNHSPT